MHVDMHSDLKMADEHTEQVATQPAFKDWFNLRLAYNLATIAMAMVLFGYDNAVTSPLVSLPLFVLKYGDAKSVGSFAFTANDLDLLVCVPLVGAVLGAFIGVPLQRWLGRKNTMLIAYALTSVPGSFLQLFAPNMAAMIVGRLWNNIGISILTSVVPLFMAELVPAHVRGRVTGMAAAGSGASSVIATVVVWGTAKLIDDRQYKIPLAVQAALAGLLFIMSLFLTESPAWLVSKGRIEDARTQLLKLRRQNEAIVDHEINSIAAVLAAASEAKSSVRFKEILARKNWARTFMASSYLPAGQVGGQSLAITYSTVLFVQAGVSNAFLMTILVFLLQFLGNMVGPFLSDRLGRRTIALGGISTLVVLDFTAGGLACGGLKTNPQILGLAALSCIFAFVNAASFQSLAYIFPTEIPDAKLREPTMTWSLFWSYATAIITTFATPQIINPDAGNLGAKAYLIFGGCALIVVIYSYFLLPETARRTLDEIDDLYRQGVPPRKWGRKKNVDTVTEVELQAKDAAITAVAKHVE
ncbi:hypothetical protein Sste5346_005975 [Sporothrix stenoceras]|uniref:Major facilitator superfamily (MFS) profile domain-containing protein n=1 Tax=Sporothrix stenoceras TaxID=5173 RepID=A0ABR3Z0N3_9PEZI